MYQNKFKKKKEKKLLCNGNHFSVVQVVPNLHQHELNFQNLIGRVQMLIALQEVDSRFLEFQQIISVTQFDEKLPWAWTRRLNECAKQAANRDIQTDVIDRFVWRQFSSARFATAHEMIHFQHFLANFRWFQQTKWIAVRRNRLVTMEIEF